MLFDPVTALIAIPLELALLAPLVRWREWEARTARLLARLDRQERGETTLRVRGVVVLAGLVLAALAAGLAVTALAREVDYGLFVEALGLGLLLRSGSTVRLVFAAALDTDFQTNRARIGAIIHGLVDGLLAPIFWFLLGGLPAAAVYRAIALIAAAGRERGVIAAVPARLATLAIAPPAVIGAALLVVAALFVPRGNSTFALRFALWPGRAARGLPAARAVAAAAGALGVVVEGNGGWLGPESGRARVEVAEVARAGLLGAVAGLIAIAVLIVLAVADL